MSGAASGDVLSGHVGEWHSEEGWGVLVTPTLPEAVWAHYSAVEAEGFRALTVGQAVTFTVEQAEQDQFRWRAVHVWPSGPEPLPEGHGEGPDGPGYSSSLDITFDS
ncbi:cold shock domain-containing protein [Streptomyces sp. ICN441]|uniref:cold-shock protein n=1 Tax=Streptomyces sp. ICN441 TaxID=2558286 RepID=UPI001F100AA1|nr:cold shock domain-containing protein [Streptomyces sp. ICN441]